MATEDLMQLVSAKADQLKTDATNSVQALRQTAQTLDTHAQTLKTHLGSLLTEAHGTITKDVSFVKVHWPWLVAAVVVGAAAVAFVRF